MTVTLRYWAAAKEAAGVAEESFDDVADLAALLAAATAVPGRRVAAAATGQPSAAALERVLSRCSFLVNGDPVGLRPHVSVPLPGAAVIEALPPFAGG